MRVDVTDLDGKKMIYDRVDRYAFANQDTHSLPASLESEAGKTLLIINANNFVTVAVDLR